MVNKEFRSPVYHISAVPFENIVPNTYNPNNVAPPEMRLLYDSIKEDGYTMPIVCNCRWLSSLESDAGLPGYL